MAIKPPSVSAPKPATPAKIKASGLHPAGAGRLAAPQGPSAQTPDQFAAAQSAKAQSSLQQYLNYLSTQMGRIDMNQVGQQAQTLIGQQTAPLLAGNTAWQQAAASGVTGYTKSLADVLGGIAPGVAAGYQQAEGQQAALDQSIADRLTAAGQGGADQMQQLLAARGQDTSPAAQAASQAAGAGAASYATGSAALSNLYAQGAANNAYYKGLPGIAALAGNQALEQVNADAAGNAAKILSDAQSQYPSLIASIQSQTLAQQKDTADALYRAAQASAAAAKNATSDAVARQKLAQAAKLAKLADAIRRDAVGVSQQNADTASFRAQTGANSLGYRTSSRFDPSASRAKGYEVDQYGQPIGGKIKPLPGFKLKPGGGGVVKVASTSGSATTQRWDAKALAGARAGHAGVTDSKGVYHNPLSWQQYLTEGLAEGIPMKHLIEQGKKVYSQTEIKQGLIPKGKNG